MPTIASIDPRIEIGTVTQTLRVDGAELIAAVGRFSLRAFLRDDRFVFTGGNWGEHSIAADVSITSAARLLAHWQGYVESNAQVAAKHEVRS